MRKNENTKKKSTKNNGGIHLFMHRHKKRIVGVVCSILVLTLVAGLFANLAAI